MLATTVLAAGCQGIVYQNEGDCENVYELQFVYDHNLKWADAFASEVDAVTVHLFNASTGALVKTYTDGGEHLAREGYAIRLDVPPGDYEMVAWCGQGAHDNGHSFSVAKDVTSPSVREHLTCYMQRSRDLETQTAHIDQEGGINHLYHGTLRATLPAEDGTKLRLKLPLVKNTNSVKVVLQSLKGKEIKKEDYKFTIEDKNGHYDWDNSIIPDEPLTYHSWAVAGGSAEILDSNYDAIDRGSRADAGSTMSAVVADLTVGRLMANHRPILTVRKTADNEVLFRIPLTDYALMVKGNYRKTMTDQEYLDRQDEYNMTFFLDEKGEWIDTYIYINKWKVVLMDADME